MTSKVALFLAGALAIGVAHAEAQPLMITETASNAVQAMGKSLANTGLAFHQHTIREYTDANGQPLHIVHNGDILARRPDRLAVKIDGDDGATSIDYNGQTVTVYRKGSNKYLSLPVTGDLEQMFKTVAEKFDVDFPLADFLATAPDQAFMGRGHLRPRSQYRDDQRRGMPPSAVHPAARYRIATVDRKERTLTPLRVIVTYRSLPGEPRFIAELSDWKLNLTPADTDFVFTPPPNATKVELPEKAP